ncbi:hypothetical protein LTS18_001183, partial [Coniosporium uncinatum]
ERVVVDKPAVKGKKRKSAAVDDDGDEEDDTPKKAKSGKAKASAKPATKSPAKKKVKTDDAPESAEIQSIMANIPTVRAPTPPPKDASGKPAWKFGGAHTNSGPPPAEGSKEVPVGEENCLAGMSFVFTGLLQTIGRDEATNLVKQYGGKVTGAPSKKTTFVVLGSDAGPSKLEKIRSYGLKTIDEDGLYALIRSMPANGGDSKAGKAYEEKKKKEEDQIKKMAEEMGKAEPKASGAGGVKSSPKKGGVVAATKKAEPDVDNQLWTVKYAPTQIAQICGNKAAVEKLQRWLRSFPKNQKHNFKMGGPDGSGLYRAVIIHGPPGIGKTTAAHLVARLEGYDVVESNASDTRSKKLVESGLKGVLSTTSLLGYFA